MFLFNLFPHTHSQGHSCPKRQDYNTAVDQGTFLSQLQWTLQGDKPRGEWRHLPPGRPIPSSPPEGG